MTPVGKKLVIGEKNRKGIQILEKMLVKCVSLSHIELGMNVFISKRRRSIATFMAFAQSLVIGGNILINVEDKTPWFNSQKEI